MAAMLQALKGGALWAALAIVLATIGSATYLASQAILSGSDVLAIITPILAGTVGVTTAHVVGQATLAAGVSTMPAGSPTAVAPPPSAPDPEPPIVAPPGPAPAMPAPGS
jgi:hypothetical protein